MDRESPRAYGGGKEHASTQAALLSPRYDVAPRPPPGNSVDAPRRDSRGGILPALAPVAHHPPSSERTSSPNAFKRTGWTTPRSPPAGEPPRFPGIEGQLRQRSRPLHDDASSGSLDSESDWYESPKMVSRYSEEPSIPDNDLERDQLAYMEEMYSTISSLTDELEKERRDRARLEDKATINRLVTESEYSPVDTLSTLTPTLTELDDAAHGFSPMTRTPATSVSTSRSFRPSPPQPHQLKRPIAAASALRAQLPKEQVELCAALGKNAELRIRTREMERTTEKSSQELDQAQKQVKLVERRILNREEKLRGLLKEKMQWQKELKDMRDQVVEEKMRQVDIYRRMESLKREHATQLEELERALQSANAENEELQAYVSELRSQQAYQARRLEELGRQSKEEKDNFSANIVETRQRFKEWKENEANALRASKEQALSNMKTEYELKIARHQEEKQKLRDKVKDLEVSLKLMQKDRTLSPLELRLRKATILGGRDNGGTSETELIEAQARIRELETLLDHSHEYQQRQDNIIKVSEATISRLVQEREVTALDHLSAHPLPLTPVMAGGDEFGTFTPMGIAGSRSPRDVRKPSHFSNPRAGMHDKSKSISPSWPSHSYSPAMTAVPDTPDDMAGRNAFQERKPIRSEQLHVSTLDAVAPITPVVTPKLSALVAAPPSAAPPSKEIPSAKEEYLVSELARLRSELEQVNTRQTQSEGSTLHTAEDIHSCVLLNDSNTNSKSDASNAAASSLKIEADQESTGVDDSVRVDTTAEPENGDLCEDMASLIDAPGLLRSVETESPSLGAGEVEPSALDTPERDESKAPPYSVTEESVSKPHTKEMESESLLRSASQDHEAPICLDEKTESKTLSAETLQVEEETCQGEQTTAADTKEGVELEYVPEIATSAAQGRTERDDTATLNGTDDNYLSPGSLSIEQVWEGTGVEEPVGGSRFVDSTISVNSDIAPDALEGESADLVQASQADAAGKAMSNLEEELIRALPSSMASITDLDGMKPTEGSEITALASVNTEELKISEAVERDNVSTSISDPDIETHDTMNKSVQLDVLYDAETVLDAKEDSSKQVQGEDQVREREELSKSIEADANSTESTINTIDTEVGERASQPDMSPAEALDSELSSEIDPLALAVGLPVTLAEVPTAPTDIGAVESVTMPAHVLEVNDACATVSAISLRAADDPDIAMSTEARVYEPEAGFEIDTVDERNLPTLATIDSKEPEELETMEEDIVTETKELNNIEIPCESGFTQPDENENACMITETERPSPQQPSMMILVTDEYLMVEVTAAVIAIVDECCANDSVSLSLTENLSVDDGAAQSLSSSHSPNGATAHSGGDSKALVPVRAVEVASIVSKETHPRDFNTDDDMSTVESSNCVDPASNSAHKSEETQIMVQVAAILADLASQIIDEHFIEASGAMLVSDAMKSYQMTSQTDETNHNIEQSASSLAHQSLIDISLLKEQGVVYASEAAEASKPSCTSIEDYREHLEAVHGAGSIDVASTAVETRDGHPEPEGNNVADPARGLQSLVQVFCRDVIASVVAGVSTRQPSSDQTTLQEPVDACDEDGISVFKSEQGILEIADTVISDCLLSDDKPEHSTTAVNVKIVHQDDCVLGEVGESVVAVPSSMLGQQIECDPDVLAVLNQAIDTIHQKHSINEDSPLRLTGNTLLDSDLSLASTVDFAIVNRIEAAEGIDFLVDPAVEEVVREMVDDTVSWNEQSLNSMIFPEGYIAPAERIDHGAQLDRNTPGTDGHADADAVSMVSHDAGRIDGNNVTDEVLTQLDQSVAPMSVAVTQAIGESSESGERSEGGDQRPDITEKLVDGAVDHGATATVHNSLSDGVEETKQLDEAAITPSGDCQGEGNGAVHNRRSHEISEDVYHINPGTTFDGSQVDEDRGTTSIVMNVIASIIQSISTPMEIQERSASVNDIAQELAIGAVARAVASALVSVEIQLRIDFHDAEEVHMALLDSSALPERRSTQNSLVSVETIVREIAVGAVSRAVSSALVSAKIQLTMEDFHDEKEEEIQETPINLLPCSPAAEATELSLPIGIISREIAVGVVARAMASALVSIGIQLNMENICVESDDLDGYDNEETGLSTDSTSSKDDVSIKRESTVDKTEVIRTERWQGTSEPEADPDVADLLGVICSAIVAQFSESEELEQPDDHVGSELRSAVEPTDVTEASTEADKVMPRKVEAIKSESAMHCITSAQCDDLTLAAVNEQVCQVLNTVLATVASMSAPSVCAHSMDGMSAAAPCQAVSWQVEGATKETEIHCITSILSDGFALTMDEQVREALDSIVDAVSGIIVSNQDNDSVSDPAAASLFRTASELPSHRDKSVISSHTAVEQAIGEVISSLLVQLEATHVNGTEYALHLTSDIRDADNSQEANRQPPSVPFTEEMDAKSVPTTPASDSEVYAVLKSICAQIEQSSTNTPEQHSIINARNSRQPANHRSSQSTLPTVFERRGHDIHDRSAPSPATEDRRGSTRRPTKRSGSILAPEQLLAWDISPSVVDVTDSTLKRYATKRRTSRRGSSEPFRLPDPSSGQNPHLLAYDMRNENGEQPFSLLDAEMLRIDPSARHISQDDGASEIIAKRKKMHYEAYCKSMTQRTTPVFNYTPMSIKFEWSDFVVAAPVSPSSRLGPVQKLRLLLKKGLQLPCGQYVIVSAFVRPLEDGNENLRVQIYDSERVEEFIFDFLDDQVKKYVIGWSGTDEQAREFVNRLYFRREQSAIIIKLPEKKGLLLDTHDRRTRSDNGLTVNTGDESRLGSTITLEQPEGGNKSEARTPKSPGRRRMHSMQRPASSPRLSLHEPRATDKGSSGEDSARDGQAALSAVLDGNESSAE